MELDEKNLRALVSLLSDDDVEVLSHVKSKIIALGDSMIPFLEEEWENNLMPDVQKRIENLIHALQFETLQKRLQAWHDGGAEDLLEGMWLVATYQYPDLEITKLRTDLEQIYYETWLEMRNDLLPIDHVKILNSILFGKLKFAANTKNFHSPSNSMINVVLDTKKGNPISLCVIYILVAQKLKLPIYGVNLPNLFICTYKDNDSQFYINVFNKGLIFSKSDIDNYISQLNLAPMDIFYEPCSNIDIVRRVFRNLASSFEKVGEKEKIEEIQLLLKCLSKDNETDMNIL